MLYNLSILIPLFSYYKLPLLIFSSVVMTGDEIHAVARAIHVR